MNPIGQGLVVSGVGIIILFITASIFFLLIVGLRKAFPYKEEVEEETEEAAPVAVVAPVVDTDEEAALAAAIAVAIATARSRAHSSLGSTLQRGPGAWWSANRTSTPAAQRSQR